MTSANDVEIRVLPYRKAYRSNDLQDESQVVAIIRDRVLPQSDAEYYRVDVKIHRRKDATPQYLVAYMLRKDVYLAEVVRVEVDAGYQERGITFNYADSQDTEEEEDEEEDIEEFDYSDDWYEPEFNFVAATPVPDIVSAKAAVEFVHGEATRAGLRSKLLLGAEATVANYKRYLASGLKGFVNVGHGNTSSIVLHDGTLPATWFQSLAAEPLRPAAVYFNSCQVHNDPLKSAVMHSGARTFVGGIVNLLIGPSEEVCKCFWSKTLTSGTRLDDALHQCEISRYPSEGAHGITGDLEPFNLLNLKLAHAMWVHGHNVQIECPERLDVQGRMGFYVRLRGKPFTSNWLHFAVPTPVIVDSNRLRVGSVMIRFRTGPGVSVYAVHIYDGETKIAAHDGLNMSPQDAFISPRFDVPTHPAIKWGLGISIGVKFGDAANLPPNKLLLEISSAGCDFMVAS